MTNNTCTTIILCAFAVLLATSYCVKIKSNAEIKIQTLYSGYGLTQMDVECSKVGSRNAAQTAVCIAYFNNKGK